MQDAQNELACTDANAKVDVTATVKWVDVRASDGLVLRTMHGILLYLTSSKRGSSPKKLLCVFFIVQKTVP